MVTPLLVPLLIIGGKFDIYQVNFTSIFSKSSNRVLVVTTNKKPNEELSVKCL